MKVTLDKLKHYQTGKQLIFAHHITKIFVYVEKDKNEANDILKKFHNSFNCLK